ncbi:MULTISPECIES: hypothetical protein [Bacillus cereus group]|uniref:Uncharacterized protein n=1 Tax=Bacillus cereus HuA4-10 TaxID=1053206 RepID=J8A4D8_BACCE|nr:MULTISPECIES: hypothetical protein [Bacillus cereus group]EJQ76483.1 hypothetical protein IGC_04393 [Bacillus cereus HuA4-10]MBJ8005810.1 hypothetical protein [Bacillus cereus]QWI48430.1 hypothetical protein EXW56_05630 [Bacillus mycoides]WJE21320.1 hypothetical protein QRY07_06100 [Bacillus cereus]
MNLKSLIIKNKEVFDKWKHELDGMIHFDLKLPNQVFQNDYGNYMFGEFDSLMYDSGWNEIRKLAQTTHDSFVIMGVLDPHPEEYYYKEFGYYNWLKLPCDLTGEQYMDVLEEYPQDSMADSIMNNSFVVVWFPPSREWIIIGDRSYGINILATKNESGLKHKFTPFYNWSSLDNFISLDFEEEVQYKEFIKNILKNYNGN